MGYLSGDTWMSPGGCNTASGSTPGRGGPLPKGAEQAYTSGIDFDLDFDLGDVRALLTLCVNPIAFQSEYFARLECGATIEVTSHEVSLIKECFVEVRHGVDAFGGESWSLAPLYTEVPCRYGDRLLIVCLLKEADQRRITASHISFHDWQWSELLFFLAEGQRPPVLQKEVERQRRALDALARRIRRSTPPDEREALAQARARLQEMEAQLV